MPLTLTQRPPGKQLSLRNSVFVTTPPPPPAPRQPALKHGGESGQQLLLDDYHHRVRHRQHRPQTPGEGARSVPYAGAAVGVLVREVGVVQERRDGEAQAGGFEGGEVLEAAVAAAGAGAAVFGKEEVGPSEK